MAQDRGRSAGPRGAAADGPDRPGARLMTPGQAAEALAVAPRTVARWAEAGRILAVRTPGGHRRYRADDVHSLRRARTD